VIASFLLAIFAIAPDAGQPPKYHLTPAMKAELEAQQRPPVDAGLPPPFQWKLSNVLNEIDIDGLQMANDVPVKLHGVVVKGRGADVMTELIAHFERSGLFMVPPDQQQQLTRQVQVTALDSTRAISYTAILDPRPDGTCMVMLGEANLGLASRTALARKEQNQQLTYFAPLMPNATAPFRSDVERMHTVSYSVTATEAEVKKFYQEQLKQRGYTEPEANLFRKNDEEIEVTTKRGKSGVDVLLIQRPAEKP
jgi:hypothetical protein